jgi:hypothetical protein
MRQLLFTPASAERALATIRPVAERMCRVYRALEARRPARPRSDQPVDRTYFELLNELHIVLARLDACGVKIRDPRRGLVDFPARRAGRRVLLCWGVGEGAPRFWREIGTPFARRKPVVRDDAWEESDPRH